MKFLIYLNNIYGKVKQYYYNFVALLWLYWSKTGNILNETFCFLQCQKPHFKEVSANYLKKVKKMIEKNNIFKC